MLCAASCVLVAEYLLFTMPDRVNQSSTARARPTRAQGLLAQRPARVAVAEKASEEEEIAHLHPVAEHPRTPETAGATTGSSDVDLHLVPESCPAVYRCSGALLQPLRNIFKKVVASHWPRQVI